MSQCCVPCWPVPNMASLTHWKAQDKGTTACWKKQKGINRQFYLWRFRVDHSGPVPARSGMQCGNPQASHIEMTSRNETYGHWTWKPEIVPFTSIHLPILFLQVWVKPSSAELGNIGGYPSMIWGWIKWINTYNLCHFFFHLCPTDVPHLPMIWP